MSYTLGFPGEETQLLDHVEIHKSAAQVAREAYTAEYGIDYHDDPEWVIGGDRHKFWLAAFDNRQKDLILDPNQD